MKRGSDPPAFSLDSAPVVFHRLIVGPETWTRQLQQVSRAALRSSALWLARRCWLMSRAIAPRNWCPVRRRLCNTYGRSLRCQPALCNKDIKPQTAADCRLCLSVSVALYRRRTWRHRRITPRWVCLQVQAFMRSSAKVYTPSRETVGLFRCSTTLGTMMKSVCSTLEKGNGYKLNSQYFIKEMKWN